MTGALITKVSGLVGQYLSERSSSVQADHDDVGERGSELVGGVDDDGIEPGGGILVKGRRKLGEESVSLVSFSLYSHILLICNAFQVKGAQLRPIWAI